jgi:hypothetical protein
MRPDDYGTIYPTPLQDLVAEACAAIMRELLPTRADKELVVAVLYCAASHDPDCEDDRMTALVEKVAYSTVLDIYGTMPPRATLQARLGNKEAPWDRD